jgi:hypothetical protein
LYFHKKEETKGKKKYIGGYGIHTWIPLFAVYLLVEIMGI